jgi:hypothetical protein
VPNIQGLNKAISVGVQEIAVLLLKRFLELLLKHSHKKILIVRLTKVYKDFLKLHR